MVANGTCVIQHGGRCIDTFPEIITYKVHEDDEKDLVCEDPECLSYSLDSRSGKAEHNATRCWSATNVNWEALTAWLRKSVKLINQ